MAFTRKQLKAMGFTDEQVESLIEMHSEVVDGLKKEAENYKADADKLAEVQSELKALKEKGGEDFKAKYEKEHSDFEKYKRDIAEKETENAKNAAFRKYLESKGITGKNLEIAMRGIGKELSAAELEGEKIKDTTALDELIKGDFAGLVGKEQKRGASTATPPGGNGSGGVTKESIMAVKDRAERRRMIAENIELFDKKEN